MPERDIDYSAADQATMDRERRKRANQEDRVEHMEESIKNVISKALKRGYRKGVAKDFLAATKNDPREYKSQGGFGAGDDVSAPAQGEYTAGVIVTGRESYIREEDDEERY